MSSWNSKAPFTARMHLPRFLGFSMRSCYLVSGPKIVPAGLGFKAIRAGNKMFPNCISLTGCSVASHDESWERFVKKNQNCDFLNLATREMASKTTPWAPSLTKAHRRPPLLSRSCHIPIMSKDAWPHCYNNSHPSEAAFEGHHSKATKAAPIKSLLQMSPQMLPPFPQISRTCWVSPSWLERSQDSLQI